MSENSGWPDPQSIERLLDAAGTHAAGSGDADHEIGDLQLLLRNLWNAMNDAQKLAFRKSDSVDQALFFLEADHVTDVTPNDVFIEHCLDAARDHGNASEPDHEPGDLQDMARDGWRLLDGGQRSDVAARFLALQPGER